MRGPFGTPEIGSRQPKNHRGYGAILARDDCVRGAVYEDREIQVKTDSESNPCTQVASD